VNSGSDAGKWITIVCGLALLCVLPLACAAHGPLDRRHTEGQVPLPTTEAWASASQSTLPESMQLYVPPGRPPLSSQACPFRGAEVPVCRRHDSEQATLEKLNRVIRVRGTLAAKPVGCTQRNCPSDAPYCNRVNGALLVETAGEALLLADGQSPWRAGSGFNCVGDGSALCCGFNAMDEEVIVEGTLRSADAENQSGAQQRLLYLQATGFCRSGEANHETTNLSKLEMPVAAVCH
jgi:hypothetical protein